MAINCSVRWLGLINDRGSGACAGLLGRRVPAESAMTRVPMGLCLGLPAYNVRSHSHVTLIAILQRRSLARCGLVSHRGIIAISDRLLSPNHWVWWCLDAAKEHHFICVSALRPSAYFLSPSVINPHEMNDLCHQISRTNNWRLYCEPIVQFRYQETIQVNSAFHPSGAGKSSTPRMAECVHLRRMASKFKTVIPVADPEFLNRGRRKDKDWSLGA